MEPLFQNLVVDAFIKVSLLLLLLVAFTIAFYYAVNNFVKGIEFKNVFVCFLVTIITDVFISTSVVVYGIIKFFFLKPILFGTGVDFPFYLLIIPAYMVFITTFSFMLTGKWLPLDNFEVENKNAAVKGALIYLGITVFLPFVIASIIGYYPLIHKYLSVQS